MCSRKLRNFITELQTILIIAKNNGYNHNDVQNIYNKVHNNSIIRTIYPHLKTKTRFVSTAFHHQQTYSLQRILGRYQVSVTNGNNFKLANILLNNKKRPDTINRCGVYKISCNDCNKYYIGQCGRTIKERLKEHQTRTNSALGRHLKIENHSCDVNNVKLLNSMTKSYKMDLWEEYYITRHKKTDPDALLNDVTNFNNQRLFLDYM